MTPQVLGQTIVFVGASLIAAACVREREWVPLAMSVAFAGLFAAALLWEAVR